MITFTEWLKLREDKYAPVLNTGAGRINSRPGATFLANRSQLWGPSAHFGQPDQMVTWDKKVVPAFLGSIGDAYKKALGRDIIPIPRLDFPEQETDEHLGVWVVLPLQLPPSEYANSTYDYRTVQKMLDTLGQDPVLHPGEQPSPQKFRIPNFDKYEEVEDSIEFTTALCHLAALNKVKSKGDQVLFQLDWQSPDIQTRINNANLEALVIFDKLHPKQALGQGGSSIKQYNDLARKYGFEDDDNNAIPDPYDAQS